MRYVKKVKLTGWILRTRMAGSEAKVNTVIPGMCFHQLHAVIALFTGLMTNDHCATVIITGHTQSAETRSG